MKFTVELSQNASRYLRRLDRPTQERVARSVRELADDPFGPGTKGLAAARGSRAMRVGNWRIVFQVDIGRRIVSVSDIGPRGQVYRNL